MALFCDSSGSGSASASAGGSDVSVASMVVGDTGLAWTPTASVGSGSSSGHEHGRSRDSLMADELREGSGGGCTCAACDCVGSHGSDGEGRGREKGPNDCCCHDHDGQGYDHDHNHGPQSRFGGDAETVSQLRTWAGGGSGSGDGGSGGDVSSHAGGRSGEDGGMSSDARGLRNSGDLFTSATTTGGGHGGRNATSNRSGSSASVSFQTQHHHQQHQHVPLPQSTPPSQTHGLDHERQRWLLEQQRAEEAKSREVLQVLTAKDSQIAALSRERNELAAQLQGVVQDNVKLVARLEAMQQHTQRNASLVTERDALQRKFARMEEELSKLRLARRSWSEVTDLHSKLQEQYNALKGQLEASRQDVMERDNLCQQLGQRVDDLVASSAMLKSQVDQRDVHVQTLQQQLREMGQVPSPRKATPRRSLDESQHHDGNTSFLDASQASILAAGDGTTSDGQLQGLREEIMALSDTCDQQQRELHELHSLNAKLATKPDVGVSQSVQADLEVGTAAADALQRLRLHLEEQYGDRMVAAERKMLALEREHASKQLVLRKDHDSVLQQLQQQLDDKTRAARSFEEQLGHSKTVLAALETDLDATRTEAQRQVANIRQHLISESAVVKAHQKAITELHRELENSQTELAGVLAERDSLEAQLAHYPAKPAPWAQHEVNMTTLLAENRRLRHTVGTLQKQATAWEEVEETHRAELAKAQEAAQTVAQQLLEEGRRHEATQRQVEQAEKRGVGLAAENHRLQQQLIQAQMECQTAKTAVVEMEGSLQRLVKERLDKVDELALAHSRDVAQLRLQVATHLGLDHDDVFQAPIDSMSLHEMAAIGALARFDLGVMKAANRDMSEALATAIASHIQAQGQCDSLQRSVQQSTSAANNFREELVAKFNRALDGFRTELDCRSLETKRLRDEMVEANTLLAEACVRLEAQQVQLADDKISHMEQIQELIDETTWERAGLHQKGSLSSLLSLVAVLQNQARHLQGLFTARSMDVTAVASSTLGVGPGVQVDGYSPVGLLLDNLRLEARLSSADTEAEVLRLRCAAANSEATTASHELETRLRASLHQLRVLQLEVDRIKQAQNKQRAEQQAAAASVASTAPTTPDDSLSSHGDLRSELGYLHRLRRDTGSVRDSVPPPQYQYTPPLFQRELRERLHRLLVKYGSDNHAVDDVYQRRENSSRRSHDRSKHSPRVAVVSFGTQTDIPGVSNAASVATAAAAAVCVDAEAQTQEPAAAQILPKAERTRLLEDARQARNQYKLCLERVHAVEQQLEVAEDKLKKMQLRKDGQLNGLKAKLAAAEQVEQQQAEQAEDAKQQLVRAEQKLQKMEAAVRKANAAVATYKAKETDASERELLTQQLRISRQQLQEKSRELASTRASAKSLREQVSDLQADLLTYRGRESSTDTAFSKLHDSFRALQQEHAACASQQQTQARQLESICRQLDDANSTILDLRKAAARAERQAPPLYARATAAEAAATDPGNDTMDRVRTMLHLTERELDDILTSA
eukprot:m.250154 g.250154  ORF g.250154 m.250154 type:complete len:1508 (-) comp19096_c0_seq3:33-4556(-)